MNTQTAKPKRAPRKKHQVQIICTKCGSPFNSKALAHLCPKCRPQAKPQNVAKPQRPQQTPKPQRPQHQQKPQTQPAQTSKASSIANRMSRTAAPLRPGRSIVTAIQRLLMMLLDPAATSGQRAVRLNIDNISAPKYPVQFDCNFTVYADTEFKFLLASSPIISAVIYSNDGNLQIFGAESYQVAGPKGFYTYVLGNKKNLVVDNNGNLVVTSKEDFREFRMIGSSMRMQWSGQEIFKNGTYNIARITDNEDLADFNPNVKIDSIIANVSDVVVATSQRKTANSQLLPVDPNNNDAGGVRPDGGFKKAYETIVLTGGLPGPLDSGTLNYAFASNTTFTGMAGGIQAAAYSFYQSNAEYKRIFDTFISQLVAKYPEFYNSGSGGYNCSVTSEIDLTATMLPLQYQSFHFQSTPNRNMYGQGPNNVLFNDITSELAATAPAGNVTPQATGTKACVFRQVIVFAIPIDGRINQRVMIPNFLTLGVDENSLADTVFYDNSFLEPVIHAQGSQMQVQVLTSHAFEFLLSDDTVLAAAAVANTPKDAEAVINVKEHNTIQKIMKGMPPGLIQGDLGMGRVSSTQLASRGILKDIMGVLGPLATQIFPSAASTFETIGGVVDML